MYLAFGIIFLILELSVAGFLIYTTVRTALKGGEVISKKSFIYLVPCFLLIFFLYLTAAFYSSKKIDFFYIFSLFYSTTELFKLKQSFDLIEPIIRDYGVYYADFVIVYLLSVATLVLSISSLFSQRLRNFFGKLIAFNRNCDIVMGDSRSAVKYAKKNKNCVLWGAGITLKRYGELLKEGVTVTRASLDSKRMSRRIKRGEHNVVVFRDSEFSYTKLIETFSEIKRSGAEDLFLHLEANQREMKVINEKFIYKAEKEAGSFITCFSKYELLARKFVAEYPLTKFIPREFFNDNLTLKEDKDINVVFIGFGKVNYQLFKTFLPQFQFAAERGGKLYSKPVNYYVFENTEERLHNDLFTKLLYEFDENFSDCDFPKPEKICNLNVPQKTDINSVEAKKRFKSLVTDSSFTYFIVSLESDLEDASYARTVKRLLPNEGNYKIFVRAKNNNSEKLDLADDNIVYFGDEKNSYTHDFIINDELTERAQRLNMLYGDINNPPEWLEEIKGLPSDKRAELLDKQLKDDKNRRLMRNSWTELPLIRQDSNIDSVLNQSFKLGLLGFDVTKEKCDRKVSENQFYESYVNPCRSNGYNDYSLYFKTESGNVLAFIEHLRWNALYFLHDYTQMKKSEMKLTGGEEKKLAHKDEDNKKHACLTTYYGLDDLIKFKFGKLYPQEGLSGLSQSDERLLELGKLYAYDYMGLDRIYTELTTLGYNLIDKK